MSISNRSLEQGSVFCEYGVSGLRTGREANMPYCMLVGPCVRAAPAAALTQYTGASERIPLSPPYEHIQPIPRAGIGFLRIWREWAENGPLSEHAIGHVRRPRRDSRPCCGPY